MMHGDLPNIGSSAYGASTSTFSLANGGLGLGHLGAAVDEGLHKVQNLLGGQFQPVPPIQHLRQDKPAMAAAPSRRLVQVFIADTDDNVPLDKSLLYSGEQKLTDATDQELFFEIDIKGVLAAHNAERVKLINKKAMDRTEHLEPAKIRDLKMVVVNVATF